MKRQLITKLAMLCCMTIMMFSCSKSDQVTPQTNSVQAERTMAYSISVFSVTEPGEKLLEQLPFYTDQSVLTIHDGYQTDGTEQLIINGLNYAASLSNQKYGFVIKLKSKAALYLYPEDELQNDADIAELNSWLNDIFQSWLNTNDGTLQSSDSNPNKSVYLSMVGTI